MSFNIEWTNADALTPSPITVIKDGCHYEFKVDAHYLTDEQLETVRRHVETLQAENAKLREQIHWLKQGDILHVLTDQEYIDQCERERLMQVSIDALDKENAKLRELVAAMPYCMESRCLECPMCSPFDTSIGGVPECRASWKLRELGVDA